MHERGIIEYMQYPDPVRICLTGVVFLSIPSVGSSFPE